MRRSLVVSLLGIIVVALGALGLTLAFGDSPELGLDLQGGISVVLEPTADTSDGAIDQAIEIIRNRVDGLGVAEPEITRQGDAIVVALPGVADQQRALELVGQTAELRFRPVIQALSPEQVGTDPTATTVAGDPTATTVAPTATTVAPTATTAAASDAGTATTAAASGSALGRSAGGGVVAATTTSTATTVAESTTTVADPTATTVVDPTATTVVDPTATTVASVPGEVNDDPTQQVVLPMVDDDGNTEGLYVLGPAVLTGRAVQSASAEFATSGTQGWQVAVTFRDGAEGIDLFNQLAAQCYQAADQAACPTGQAAITLDGVVISAPTINSPSFSRDQVSISGSFSEGEAKDLALVLRYGALPVELEPQAVQTVSATLGEDSLRAGIVAGLVGLGLVVLLMVLYYRALGIVAFLGLALSGALMWSVISWLAQSNGLTLTLAGATGIIVSIGVTVDSYVVYFERLKDDVKMGKSLRSSAERGFTTAFRTILAADVASLIGAAVLYWLTVGGVRGFAFFLGLSTVLDIVVAYFFTRPLVILMARRMHGSRLLGVGSGDLPPGVAATSGALP